MEIQELRKMTVPKLRDLAKQSTELQGVMGMKKEQLIEAIAQAQSIAYDAAAKDVTTISSIKQQIRALQKQRDELLAVSKERVKVHRIRRKIKTLKRVTRALARKAGPKESPQASAPTESAQAPAG